MGRERDYVLSGLGVIDLLAIIPDLVTSVILVFMSAEMYGLAAGLVGASLSNGLHKFLMMRTLDWRRRQLLD